VLDRNPPKVDAASLTDGSGNALVANAPDRIRTGAARLKRPPL
jgi:hypothetical protein